MSDDQFTKLFRYVEEFRSEMNTKLDEKASQQSLDRLTNTIDTFIKRLDDSETEQAAPNAQFERLVEWTKEVSKKTGVPLPNP